MQQPDTAAGEREQRAERILDAAAELLIAWGYRRVAIDEVARRAGVGKGTVYLHFSTKEALFLTVLLRSHAAMGEQILAGMRADPAGILPSAAVRTAYLALQEDPVMRAVLTRDVEVLGTLGHRGYAELGEFTRLRFATVESWLALLREHGLLRTDTPADDQLHALFAVTLGYLVVDPLLPREPETAARADMLAHTLRSTLEASADPEALGRAAPRSIELFRHLLDRAHEEIGRQKRI
ncbi:AcrR family transcriptional regulator [Lipingzhangella halophila]|uniref:AcrR family transcriptional regulator n=1 Tax=Lipingzhangella halophila TaxID=1783352 RepID=A0A7W7W2W5_9ACTN|nr:helix-turn-helix domain-containing protein [Lipingzhangella halophila]MBB4931125.1 AcrR family transcriptional regulator [Lipingzhangella halophila]